MSAAVSLSDKKERYAFGWMTCLQDGILHLFSRRPIIEKITQVVRGKMPEWHRLNVGPSQVLFCRGVMIYKSISSRDVLSEEPDWAELAEDLRVQMGVHSYFTQKELPSEVSESFRIQKDFIIKDEVEYEQYYLQGLIKDPISGEKKIVQTHNLKIPQVFVEIYTDGLAEEWGEVFTSHIYSAASERAWFCLLKKHSPRYAEAIYNHLKISKSKIIDVLKHAGRYQKKFEESLFDSACLVLEKKADSVYGYIVIVGSGTKIFDFQSKTFFKGALIQFPEKFETLLAVHRLCGSASIFEPSYSIRLESGESFYAFDESRIERLDQKLLEVYYSDFDQVILECLKTICIFGSKGYNVEDMVLPNIYFYSAGGAKIGSIKIFIKTLKETLDYRKAIRGVIGIAYNLYVVSGCLRSTKLYSAERVMNEIGFVDLLQDEIAKHETLWASLTSAGAAGAASGGAGIVSVSSEQSLFFKDKEGFRVKVLKELIDIHQKLDSLFLDPVTFDPKLFKAEDLKKAVKGDSTVPTQIKALLEQYSRIFKLLSLLKKHC